jgi:acyl carrier protein
LERRIGGTSEPVPTRFNGSFEESAAIAAAIAELAAQQLGHRRERLNADTSIYEYGADSVIGAKLCRAIEEKFAVPIKLRDLLENDTISQLASIVSTRLGKRAPAAITDPQWDRALREFKAGQLDVQTMERLVKAAVSA